MHAHTLHAHAQGARRKKMIADTFESLLGALYLDQGLEACEEFLARCFFPAPSEVRICLNVFVPVRSCGCMFVHASFVCAHMVYRCKKSLLV